MDGAGTTSPFAEEEARIGHYEQELRRLVLADQEFVDIEKRLAPKGAGYVDFVLTANSLSHRQKLAKLVRDAPLPGLEMHVAEHYCSNVDGADPTGGQVQPTVVLRLLLWPRAMRSAGKAMCATLGWLGLAALLALSILWLTTGVGDGSAFPTPMGTGGAGGGSGALHPHSDSGF